MSPLASIIGIIGAPVSPFAWFLGCFCPPGEHERGLARLAQARPYIMCMFHGFGPLFAHISNTCCGSKACPMPEMWVLICSPKYNRGLEHGQPARRTVSKVIFDGFPGFLTLPGPNHCPNGFPIVQLMFLYEARARAPRTGTSAAQLGPHFGFFGARRTQKPKETYQS